MRRDLYESQGGVVYIIDDDAAVLSALSNTIERAGYGTRVYDSARGFLEAYERGGKEPACLLLDIRVPQMDGLALQSELKRRRIRLPVIVMSAEVDVETAVTMMRAGAVDLLQKPFTSEALLDRIEDALELQRKRAARQEKRADIRGRLQTLSTREVDVLKELAAGKATKQIAATLQIGIQTVAKHKARALKKLGAKNDLEALLLLAEARCRLECVPIGELPSEQAGRERPERSEA